MMSTTDSSRQDTMSNLKVAQMYVEDWIYGADRSPEDLTARVKTHVKDDVMFHGDGLVYKHDAAGIQSFVHAAKHTHKIFRYLEYRPLAYAANNDETVPVVFVLIHFRVQNIGEFHGHGPTYRETSGIQVEELWFDLDHKITDIWVRWQLAQEEREVLLQAPDQHPVPVFSERDIRPLAADPETSSHVMHRAMKTWVEAWNAKSKGQLDPSVLDAILAPNFTVHDACGIHGKHGHMFEISSAEGAKLAMQRITDKWDVKESLVTIAASLASNVGFTHWKATLTSRDTGHEESLDAIDVVLFKEGKLAGIWQFRTPVTYEKKYVLATEQ